MSGRRIASRGCRRDQRRDHCRARGWRQCRERCAWGLSRTLRRAWRGRWGWCWGRGRRWHPGRGKSGDQGWREGICSFRWVAGRWIPTRGRRWELRRGEGRGWRRHPGWSSTGSDRWRNRWIESATGARRRAAPVYRVHEPLAPKAAMTLVRPIAVAADKLRGTLVVRGALDRLRRVKADTVLP